MTTTDVSHIFHSKMSYVTLSLCLLLMTTTLARLDLPEEPEIPNKPEEELERPEVSSYQLSPCYTCYKDCKTKAAESCYHTCPRKFKLSRYLSLCYEMCFLGTIDRCMSEGQCLQRKEIESLTNVRGSSSALAKADEYFKNVRSILKRFEIPH